MINNTRLLTGRPAISKKLPRLAAWMLLLTIIPVTELLGQEKEDLLFDEIPIVISASRREQPITESPSAITLISAEDISHSGAVTVPDVLRMAAGVDVMSISLRDQQVSIRGLNSSQSNKLLVLVDGRSVYLDLYGNVMWDMLPVSLPEIERIEIVKSPISSLYGANAFTGVVNIITKSPEKSRGSRCHLTTGTGGVWMPAFLHGGGGKHWQYKVSAGRDCADEYIGDDSAGANRRFNGQIDFLTGQTSKISLSLGHSRTNNRKLFINQDVGETLVNGSLDYLQLNCQIGEFYCRTFFSRMDADMNFNQMAGPQSVWLSTTDIEMFHSFKPGKAHTLILGLNYRLNKARKNDFFNTGPSQHLWALYMEDQFSLSARLKITAGLRFDQHPLAGSHLSPRFNILYTPFPRHIFRFSATRAFRNPTFVNSYLDMRIRTHYLPNTPFIKTPIPLAFSNSGETGLESEGIISCEIGYLFQGRQKTNLGINLFYNIYSNFFYSEMIREYYPAGALFPGSPENQFPKAIASVYRNGGGAYGLGGEVSLTVSLNKKLTASVNYAFVSIVDKTDHPTTTLLNEQGRRDASYPMHKINASLGWSAGKRFHFNLSSHWVSGTKHHTQDVFGLESDLHLPAYFIINSRAGYFLMASRLELFISIFHLTDHRHYQFPPENSPSGLYSLETGRRIYAGLNYRF